MGMTLVSASGEVLSARPAECAYLEVALPGRAKEVAGVLLLDVEADVLHLRLRRDWESFAGEEADVLELLEADIAAKGQEWGGRRVLAFLEEHLSHTVQVSEREAMRVADFPARLRRLYREAVEPAVLAYRTHLPAYRAWAAAGGLSTAQLPEPDGWLEVPDDVRITKDMFIVTVNGRSMEPLIPDGSRCIFRQNVTGSRQGRRLLIQRIFDGEPSTELTVKEYASEKRQVGEDGWEHKLIRLSPLNPEFTAWELRPDEFAVVGEFVAVLPSDED